LLKYLFRYNAPKTWVLIHVALGLVSAFTPLPLVAFFYLFLFSSIIYIFKNKKVDPPLAILIAYLSSFELITRLAQTSPLIPYELGKYILFFLLIAGVLIRARPGKEGLLLLVLLLPAFSFDLSGEATFRDIRFNLLGTINIALAVWLFQNLLFTEKGINLVLISLVLPLISALAFTIFQTPSFDEIEFSYGGTFSTTGGFGPNQVSTAFGLGAFLTFYLWLNKFKLSGSRTLDAGIAVLFTFQGLLSFSRGGMIGGLLGVLIVLYFTVFKKGVKQRTGLNIKRIKRNLLVGSIFLFAAAFTANALTGGMLINRYKGETAGTLSGTKEKTLSTITTHRYDILIGDIDLFLDAGFFGVGAGASKYLREELNGIVAHVEASRLIAEHGVLGIIYIFIMFYLMYKVWISRKNRTYKGLLLSFIVIGWYTTFHAATRTYISPLLIGLSMIIIERQHVALLRK